MKRRLRVAAPVAVLAVVGVIAGLLVTATPGQAARDQFDAWNPDARTRQVEIDGDNDGDSDDFGDHFVGHGPLLRSRKGGKLGSLRFQCFNQGGTQSSFTILCNAGLTIYGRGTISASGPITFDFEEGGRAKIAITGGVGQFKGAEGVIELEFHSKGIEFHIDVTT